MQSKRSKAWSKKRKSLDTKEKALKSELENVSTDFESQVKKIALISAVTGVAVLSAYGIYKAFSENDTPPSKQVLTEKTPEVKVKKSGFSFKTLLVERIALIALKFIGSQLSLFLAQKFGTKESEDED